jgi:glycosyltransferase involved in cell wall biosynthesis
MPEQGSASDHEGVDDVHVAMLSSQRAFYGGEVHLRDLARALSDQGHRVTCLVRPESELAAQLSIAGLHVRTLALPNWYDPRAVLGLWRALRDLAPDILHSHTPRDYYLAAMASAGTGVCNVGTRHQLRPITFTQLKRPLLERMRAMIAVSEAVRDGLIASGLDAGRLVTVPNGVRLPADEPDAEAARTELAIPADAGPVIGYVGRLCPTKGLEALLWAASLLRGRWPALRLILVGGETGTGRHARQLRELAAQLRLSVTFVGYRPDAARLMRAFDLLAMPSRAEPFGLATVEALARGVPVVVTRSGGSREIVRDGQEGLLVPPADPDALAAAIHRLLVDRPLRARCAAAGPRRVAEAFTLERQVAATEKVYALALTGAPLPDRLVAGERRAEA